MQTYTVIHIREEHTADDCFQRVREYEHLDAPAAEMVAAYCEAIPKTTSVITVGE